jgi:hypothetical protein
MDLTEQQKQRMADNLKRAFERLNTVMKLRLIYLKQTRIKQKLNWSIKFT